MLILENRKSILGDGENRPVRWECGTNVITMTYDRMGRRVSKNDQTFIYDGYLQIADNRGSCYIWDPTEPVATRPLVRNNSEFYFHDGNKNVSDILSATGSLLSHYDYAPFGDCTAVGSNPWRFSSEYSDDDLGLIYYNYRHYDPVTGRWMSTDPIEEVGGFNLYVICLNSCCNCVDYLGHSYCRCVQYCITYNLSQLWIIIRNIDIAMGVLDWSMELPIAKKVRNIGTENLTSLGSKIFQLVSKVKIPVMQGAIDALGKWCKTSGSMTWIPGVRSQTDIIRRSAKALRNTLRLIRGVTIGALVSVTAIEGYCIGACLYNDTQQWYDERMEQYPEEFLFGVMDETQIKFD